MYTQREAVPVHQLAKVLELLVPESRQIKTRSYHRPLEAYVSGLANCGLLIDRLLELPTCQIAAEGPHARAENLANREFPVFLGLRAWKFR
jgi:hypothetical protein